MNSSSTPPRPSLLEPAVGPKLKRLLWVVFALAALLGANSLYLAAISWMEWWSRLFGEGLIYQNYSYYLMFLTHLVLGAGFAVPLTVFIAVHLRAAVKRPNRQALRMGYLLLGVCVVLIATGVALVRIEGLLELRSQSARRIVYWLHVLSPLAAIWLYVLHRLAGPAIRWRLAAVYGGLVGAFVLAMVSFHSHDPREWTATGPPDPNEYFSPSLTRTATGNFIPSSVLMMDRYCQECHQDAHDGWSKSAHRFSSFNNPAYLFSIRETRKVGMERDGTVQASRFCAGCHDPVPLLSGAFSNPKYDDEKDVTAHAGVTCTVCHAITSVNSTRGNGDYTIDEPQHYPFAFSSNPWLRFVNRQLIKAKPALHKKTFLKPVHKTSEFCSTCHKVHLPGVLTKYKDFLRGQNHYDSHLLSGVSGHGAQSFYYPKKAQKNCNECHMPPKASGDFGARFVDGEMKIHNHLFLGGNTAVPHWKKAPDALKAHQEFLRGCVRLDIFGLREGPTVDGKLHAPLRPAIPTVKPGETYLIEVVMRTLTLGHHFTQGTADSNQIWLELIAKSGDRIIGRSGEIDDDGRVDPWAFFVNNYMLDRHGNRIDRRNAQDIFAPLYDHQIPPGAAQVTHYRLRVPEGLSEPITIETRVRYRKFDLTYMRHVFGKDYKIDLPITTLASDRVVLGVEGGAAPPSEQKSAVAPWERWNDFGISLLLEGRRSGEKTGELRSAAEAFRQVEKEGRSDGPLNLSRVLYRLGHLDRAAAALRQSSEMEPPPPRWVIAWINGRIQKDRGKLVEAMQSFRSIVNDDYDELRARGFDFGLDYRVHNELGLTLYELAKIKRRRNQQEADALFQEAVASFQRVLEIDEENFTAHHNLSLIYQVLGKAELATEHREKRDRYRPYEDARGTVVDIARRNDPAANHAADGIAIYDLQRRDEPKPSGP